MNKADKEKLLTAHDDLVGMWAKAENGNDEYAQGSAEAYSQAVAKIRNAFPALFVKT